MKVAILSPFYPSAILSNAEIEKRNLKTQHPHTWITNLAAALTKKGVIVHVVTMNKEFNRDFRFQKDNIIYDFLKPASRLIRGLTLFESDRLRINRFIRKQGFDIVHGQGLNSYGYYAVMSGRPNVVTIHLYEGIRDFLSERKKYNLMTLYWMLLFLKNKQLILGRARNIISISPQVREILTQKQFKARIFDVENAIHEDFFRKVETTIGNFCIYIGSITERKNVLTLVKAVELITKLKLKIISQTTTGEYISKLKEYVTSNNLMGRIQFLGPKKNDEIIDILRTALFLVLPSNKEMAPMVISEAMAAGKPVVATGVDGIPFMTRDGETGFLIPLGDFRELSKKMELLVKNKDLCREMGEEARKEAIRRWHPDVVAEKTMVAYEKVIADWGKNSEIKSANG